MPLQKHEPDARERWATTMSAPTTASEHAIQMLAERRERAMSLDNQSRVAASSVPVSSTLPSEATSPGILATAVYVTGNTNLQPGHRYGIAIRHSRLRILGPTDIDPDVVVFDSPVAGMDAQSMGGRLILSTPQGLALAFMSVSGSATAELAAVILDEGRGTAE